MIRLEVNLDDQSPEITGATMEKLLSAGALDVWLTPIHMKKNRPGTMLSVLCEEAHLEAITNVVFRETSTFGVRIEHILRLKLERRFESVATPFGDVVIKLGLRAGEVLQRAPEFESCKKVSAASGQPLRVIYEAALRALSP